MRFFWLFVLVIRLIFHERLLSDHLLVAICFEQDVKISLEVETAFFRCLHRRKHMRIDILIYVFVSSQCLLKHSQILFSLIDETSHYFEHARLTNILTVEVDEIPVFADVYKILMEYILSRACRPSRASFYLKCFCSEKTDSDF